MAGDAVNDPLIVIRAIHFAATALTTGTLVFRAVVADPALHVGRSRGHRHADANPPCRMGRSRHHRGIRSDLATAGSGGDERSCHSAKPITADVLSTVVNETQFGQVFEIRFVLAIILAACLAFDRLPPARWLALASALGLVAAIAWTGHAAFNSQAKWDFCI